MKYAVVTGSASGIGFSIACRLIKEGYYVFLNGRKKYEFDLPNDSYCYIQAELSNIEGVELLVNKVLEKTNKVDCLVLNAGKTCRKKFSDITFDEWLDVMNVNINIPFYIVQKFNDYLVSKGSILFISSILSLKPHATSLPYGVSKAAVNSLAQCLVKEVASKGIRVNSICPGFVETDWQKEKTKLLRDKIKSKIALKRFAEPEEIADICFKVIDSSYINGAIISVDGGYDME